MLLWIYVQIYIDKIIDFILVRKNKNRQFQTLRWPIFLYEINLNRYFANTFFVPRKVGPFFMFIYIHRQNCFLQIYSFADN